MKLKRFVVDRIVEPLLPLSMLEAYVVFWGRLIYRVRRPFVIGITGSVGKSTTTSMLAAVFSHPDARRVVGSVGHTAENMNDDLGVAATLLRFRSFYILPWPYPRRLAMLCLMPFRALRVAIGPYPKVMVLEFGVGPTADFRRLVTIAPPSIAVVTRIGAAHLEKLKSIEGVVHEKGHLVRAVPADGLVVLGQGHAYVSQLEQMARAPVIKVSGHGLELSRNIARAVSVHMGVSDEVAAAGLREFKIPERRLNRLEFAHMTVIDDTYNANPLSMSLGLDTLADASRPEQRRMAILGYMAELGEEGARYHTEIGAYARTRADVLVGVGELARHYHPDHWFANSDACAREIEGLLRENDCILVKGSFTAQMERVVGALSRIAERQPQRAHA